MVDQILRPLVRLNKSSLNQFVINYRCGHCKSMTPAFEKAAKALDGIVHFGAVDVNAFITSNFININFIKMTTDQEVGAPYDVKGFPTLKFFGSNK